MPIGDHDQATMEYLKHGQRFSALAFLEAFRKLGLPHASVLDVGCLAGQWLQTFQQNGVVDIFGIDHVPDEWLVIPKDRFLRHDLDTPFDLGRRFDLVLCLETAEHVMPKSADGLVASLVKHGDLIVFGAAIPGQGGAGHVNEQEPAYWVEKFAKHGYVVVDAVRPLVWDVFMCEYWYQANALVFVSEANLDGYPALKAARASTDVTKLTRYHPKRWPDGPPVMLGPAKK